MRVRWRKSTIIQDIKINQFFLGDQINMTTSHSIYDTSYTTTYERKYMIYPIPRLENENIWYIPYLIMINIQMCFHSFPIPFHHTPQKSLPPPHSDFLPPCTTKISSTLHTEIIASSWCIFLAPANSQRVVIARSLRRTRHSATIDKSHKNMPWSHLLF